VGNKNKLFPLTLISEVRSKVMDTSYEEKHFR
jgi:hypothetical protein